MLLLKIDKSKSAIFLILLILLINYFGFKLFNLYWWLFYLITFLYFSVLVFNSIISRRFVINSYFKTEIILLIIFTLIGFFSVILNQSSVTDGVYVIIMKLIPIGFLIIIYDLVSDIRKNEFETSQKRYDTIHFGLLLLMFPIVLSQKFIFNLGLDRISAFTQNAHYFGFIALFSSLYFYFKRKNIFTLIIVLIAVILSIIADFKLGLIAFVSSILVNLIFQIKGSKRYFISIFIILILIISLVFLIQNAQYLPGRFKLLYLFTNISFEMIKQNLNYVMPAEFELFKGYIQLFTNVFNNKLELLFGLGPGNYASNIALSKQKYYAYTYVIQYRYQLDALGVSNGSFLSRDSFIINLIAEFGITGCLIYLYCFVRVLTKPLLFTSRANVSISSENNGLNSYMNTYRIIVIYMIMVMLFFPVVKDGIFIALTTYFGSLLIINSNNPNLV